MREYMKVPEKYILSFRDPRKESWDKFILILAIQNSFIIPIDLCFQPEFTHARPFVLFDTIVDVIFMFDMLLMFVTSYLDRQGNEVKDTSLIASKYVWSFRFLCDFFAVLGTGFLTQFIHSFRLFGIFKLNRVFRLSRMIADLNTHKDVKATMTMFKFTFYLFLLIHMMACSWYKVCLVHANDIDEFGVE
mgnify:CR=1 FL=1|jgi:hypothetical protein